LSRYFLKVQCKLNGSGLQYVRVRGVPGMYDDKPGLMDVQKAGGMQSTFIHRS
jgi:hypothetical protein